MTSLFTLFVARGAEVPAVDPRLAAHISTLAVVTNDNGPAARVDETSGATTLADADQSSALSAPNGEGTSRRT